MTDKEEAPGIAKITLGDAEEYFEDLGLEYNVDYTDVEKEQEKTRAAKNKKLQKEIDDEQVVKEVKKEDKEEKPEEKSLYDLPQEDYATSIFMLSAKNILSSYIR